MIFLRDEGQVPPEFSYSTSCSCWHACASFWTNFSWLYRQGGRLIFNRMLYCCRQGAPTTRDQPKLSSLDLDLAPTTYRPHGSWTSCSNPFMFLLIPAQIRTYVHAVCVWPMWCAEISIWHDHVRQAKSWLARESPPINPDGTIKLRPTRNCQPPRHGWVSLLAA
jgi:hypothetical protein